MHGSVIVDRHVFVIFVKRTDESSHMVDDIDIIIRESVHDGFLLDEVAIFGTGVDAEAGGVA